jgi:hypothetical protein
MKDDKNYLSDFEEFKNATPIAPPKEVSEKILSIVGKDLKAIPWKVFSRLSLIHLFSALFTLSICPQFGFRLFGDGMGLMGHFMSLGHYGCMIACGFFFVGMSLLFASVILKPYELLVIRKHRFTEIGALTLLSLGFFIMINPSDVVFSFALAWLLGSLAGGTIVLEIGWRLSQLRRV